MACFDRGEITPTKLKYTFCFIASTEHVLDVILIISCKKLEWRQTCCIYIWLYWSFFNGLKGQFCFYVIVLSWLRCNLKFWASYKWPHSPTHYVEGQLAALLSCRSLEIIILTWRSFPSLLFMTFVRAREEFLLAFFLSVACFYSTGLYI